MPRDYETLISKSRARKLHLFFPNENKKLHPLRIKQANSSWPVDKIQFQTHRDYSLSFLPS